jgi:hypothetical protein
MLHWPGKRILVGRSLAGWLDFGSRVVVYPFVVVVVGVVGRRVGRVAAVPVGCTGIGCSPGICPCFVTLVSFLCFYSGTCFCRRRGSSGHGIGNLVCDCIPGRGCLSGRLLVDNVEMGDGEMLFCSSPGRQQVPVVEGRWYVYCSLGSCRRTDCGFFVAYVWARIVLVVSLGIGPCSVSVLGRYPCFVGGRPMIVFLGVGTGCLLWACFCWGKSAGHIRRVQPGRG